MANATTTKTFVLLKKNIFMILPAFLVLLVVATVSFLLGSMTTELRMYRKYGDFGSNAAKLPTSAAQPTAAPVPTPAPADVEGPSDQDHIRGNSNANIVLIEYSDFDCPFCSTFHTTAQRAVDELGIMWIYRHFPLTNIHPDAQAKAEASECVFDQGGDEAFWEFADLLFTEKPAVSDLESIVSERLGLSASEFTNCVDARSAQTTVLEQMEGGSRAGVNGTPGNFIYNIETKEAIPLRGAVPFETVKSTVEAIQ